MDKIATFQNTLKLNQPINVLCETYRVKEQLDENKNVVAVFLEGVAITFGKPTRNRVSYKYDAGIKAHKTLEGKPFLDTHNDTSIRNHPPFGHVEKCQPGKNPKNGLPCLLYRVNVDPEEKDFIRKAKRGDIPGVSIQVLVESVQEMKDTVGTFLEATIREYLELSAVLIPGDGDSSMALAESFHSFKSKSSLSEGVIRPDGVQPTKKVLHDTESDDDKPLEPLDKPMSDIEKIHEPKVYGTGAKRMVGKSEDEGGNEMSKIISKEQDGSAPTGSAPTDSGPVPVEQLLSEINAKLGNIEQRIQALETSEQQEDDLGFGDEPAPEQPEGTGMAPTPEAAYSAKQFEKTCSKTFIEAVARRVIEELTGIPEEDALQKKDKKPIGPKATAQVPQTTQPANGTAPSGGEFDGNDKMGDKTEAKPAEKPAKDFPKQPFIKNSLDKKELARRHIEKAKLLLKESEGEDPTEPKPGESQKKPEPMEGAQKNTEALEEDKGEKKDEDKKEDKKEEKMTEKLSGRTSVVGTSGTAPKVAGKTSKQTMSEYLKKSGIRV